MGVRADTHLEPLAVRFSPRSIALLRTSLTFEPAPRHPVPHGLGDSDSPAPLAPDGQTPRRTLDLRTPSIEV